MTMHLEYQGNEGVGWRISRQPTSSFPPLAQQVTVILNETKCSEESFIHFDNFIGQ
jgi:hypothetical protein